MEKFIAIAAFDEDIESLRTVVLDGSLHFLHIMELAEGTIYVLEVVTNEPNVVITSRLQTINQHAMFLIAFLAQLAHLSEDGHLLVSLDKTEVVEGSMHRGGVGVIGIDDEVVLLRFCQLRTVVSGHIAFKGVINLLERNVVDIPYRDGCQHIVEIVGTNKMCLDSLPL